MENTHEIKTIQDILNVVNVDNKDNFIKDLSSFLDMFLLLRTVSKIEGKKINYEGDLLTFLCFKWIDDGKNDITINVVSKTKN